MISIAVVSQSKTLNFVDFAHFQTRDPSITIPLLLPQSPFLLTSWRLKAGLTNRMRKPAGDLQSSTWIK